MSKKYKRQLRKESSPSTASNRPFEFNPDYTPVIKDLRRIGMLAGSFILILITLSFFLR